MDESKDDVGFVDPFHQLPTRNAFVLLKPTFCQNPILSSVIVADTVGAPFSLNVLIISLTSAVPMPWP